MTEMDQTTMSFIMAVLMVSLPLMLKIFAVGVATCAAIGIASRMAESKAIADERKAHRAKVQSDPVLVRTRQSLDTLQRVRALSDRHLKENDAVITKTIQGWGA